MPGSGTLQHLLRPLFCRKLASKFSTNIANVDQDGDPSNRLILLSIPPGYSKADRTRFPGSLFSTCWQSAAMKTNAFLKE